MLPPKETASTLSDLFAVEAPKLVNEGPPAEAGSPGSPGGSPTNELELLKVVIQVEGEMSICLSAQAKIPPDEVDSVVASLLREVRRLGADEESPRATFALRDLPDFFPDPFTMDREDAALTETERGFCEDEASVRELETQLRDLATSSQALPLRLQVLRSRHPVASKRDLLQKLAAGERLPQGEASKQLAWVRTVLQIPHGRLISPPAFSEDLNELLNKAWRNLDTVCHGQMRAKRALMERYYSWLHRPQLLSVGGEPTLQRPQCQKGGKCSDCFASTSAP